MTIAQREELIVHLRHLRTKLEQRKETLHVWVSRCKPEMTKEQIYERLLEFADGQLDTAEMKALSSRYLEMMEREISAKALEIEKLDKDIAYEENEAEERREWQEDQRAEEEAEENERKEVEEAERQAWRDKEEHEKQEKKEAKIVRTIDTPQHIQLQWINKRHPRDESDHSTIRNVVIQERGKGVSYKVTFELVARPDASRAEGLFNQKRVFSSGEVSGDWCGSISDAVRSAEHYWLL